MMPVMGERDGMGLGHEILMEDGAGTGILVCVRYSMSYSTRLRHRYFKGLGSK